MPFYEFRCGVCDERFEERRAMRDVDAPATCTRGHGDAVRLLPVVAAVGSASAPPSLCGAGSGCCGGACGSS
jgi:putative FmdB family regulatory protein